MATAYHAGDAQALAHIGDTFAPLADQAQAEITQAVRACHAARDAKNPDAEACGVTQPC